MQPLLVVHFGRPKPSSSLAQGKDVCLPHAAGILFNVTSIVSLAHGGREKGCGRAALGTLLRGPSLPIPTPFDGHHFLRRIRKFGKCRARSGRVRPAIAPKLVEVGPASV